MRMSLVDDMIAVADAYAAARALSRSRVSTLVFGDGKVISRLADGADLTTRRHEGAMTWFSAHWPAEAVWPVDVPRPTPQPQPEQAA